MRDFKQEFIDVLKMAGFTDVVTMGATKPIDATYEDCGGKRRYFGITALIPKMGSCDSPKLPPFYINSERVEYI